MATTSTPTATDILEDVIQPIESTFSPELARLLLTLRLNDAAQERIRDLLSLNNAEALGPADRSALDNYLLVGQFLDLLQAKARVSLHNRVKPS
jgi:hypothetical protein